MLNKARLGIAPCVAHRSWRRYLLILSTRIIRKNQLKLIIVRILRILRMVIEKQKGLIFAITK